MEIYATLSTNLTEDKIVRDEEVDEDSDAFIIQKKSLTDFLKIYNRLKEQKLGKPLVVGYFELCKEKNRIGHGLGISVKNEEDFQNTFGAALYEQLKEAYGPPNRLR